MIDDLSEEEARKIEAKIFGEISVSTSRRRSPLPKKQRPVMEYRLRRHPIDPDEILADFYQLLPNGKRVKVADGLFSDEVRSEITNRQRDGWEVRRWHRA